MLKVGTNTLMFEEYEFSHNEARDFKINDFKLFAFGGFLVKMLSCDELVQKVRTKFLISETRGQSFVKMKLLQDNLSPNSDLKVEPSLLFKTTCPIDLQPLVYPARGNHCQHIECFSLVNFVKINMFSNERHWQC